MDKHAQTGWLQKLVTRRSVLATSTVGLAVPAVMTLGAAAPGSPVAQAKAGVVKKITMYAEYLPGQNVNIGYGLQEGKPTIPGPLLEIYEGDTIEITLVNKTDQRLSIHPHGVDYSVESDGSPLNDSFNNPGQTRVYTWRTNEMSSAEGRRFMPGSAGYWHYHDHALGDHGTGGLRKGLYGGLIVRRRGDILPEKTYVVVMDDQRINHQIAPDTPMFEANLGQRVEWLAIGHGNLYHTFHLHAHRWADNRTGMLEGPSDPSRVIDIKDLNPGTSFGFQVIAGQGVGPGAWMYHCHVQMHSDTGMSGIFLVRNADGSMPPGAQEAIDRFHKHTHPPAAADAPAPAAPAMEGHAHHN